MNNLLNTELKVVTQDQFLEVVTILAEQCVEPPLVILTKLGEVILFDDKYKLSQHYSTVVAELVDQESDETTIYIIQQASEHLSRLM